MTNIINDYSITPGDIPSASEIDLGSIAIQAADGHIYLKRTDGAVIRVTMLPGGGDQQVLYKTGSGDYALGWGTISSTLMGGALWSEVVAEVQRVFALVEGTASVLLSAPATLTAGSTGPITVSVADAAYLADGTSITGVLGTVYGTLSRSGTTYSFVSNQSYVSDVTFPTGTRFAAAFLNDTFNPLRIGSAEVEDDDSYAGSGYAYAMLDADGRVACGVKADGSLVALKPIQADINANEIFVNKLTAPGGSIDLDSSDTRLQNIIDGGAHSGDPAYGEFYAHVVLDANDRIAYGVRPDGSVAFTRQIAGEAETAAKLTPLGDNEIEEDALYDFFAHVELDSANRISRAVRLSGEHYFPKADIDQLNVKSFTVGGQPLAVRPDSLAGGPLGLFESRSDGTSYQIYRYFNGAESQLTAGSNNYNISLTSEAPERILFYSDRDGSQSAYVMNADGSDVYYANALSNIAVWGDSMSADLTKSRMQSGLAAVGASEPDRDVWNLGIGGQSSVQVAVRMGALPWTAEIVGGVIPASGQVQITNHRTPLWTQFFDDYPTAQANFGDNFLDYGSWPGSSFKDTYVTIAGVKGRIYRSNDSPNPDTYVFERVTSGAEVAVSNPVDVKVVEQANPEYPTPTSITTLTSYTSVLWPFGPHITNYILDADGNNIADAAVSAMEMSVVDAIVKQLGSLSKKFILLNEARMQPSHSLENNAMRDRFMASAIAAAYAANYSENYLDFTPYFLNGGLGVPSFNSWFQSNYPTEYAAADTGWAAEMNTYLNNPANTTVVYTETRAAATVTLTSNGSSGVTQNYLSIDTISPPDTGKPIEIRDQSRLGLRLGVNASGGVVTSLWVREGGRGYVTGDTFTIPAGTIGNTADITGTVATTRSETIGTVRNEDGTVDVANSFSQWDVDNGYIPRSARRDVIHFNSFGAEFLCLVLAAKIKSLNW
jgi:hypothetical protein